MTLGAFQISYSNVPGVATPLQPLDVWYSAGYAQDEWRLRSNLTVTAGVRFDVSKFKNEGFANPDADTLTFRDETGSPVKYSTGQMPDTKVLWSPRVGHQLGRRRRSEDAGARRHGPLQRPPGLRVDFEPARQHRRAARRNGARHEPGHALPLQPEHRHLQAGVQPSWRARTRRSTR